MANSYALRCALGAVLFLYLATHAHSEVLVKFHSKDPAWNSNEMRVGRAPVGHVNDWIRVPSNSIKVSLSLEDKWFEPEVILEISVDNLAGVPNAEIRTSSGRCVGMIYEVKTEGQTIINKVGSKKLMIEIISPVLERSSSTFSKCNYMLRSRQVYKTANIEIISEPAAAEIWIGNSKLSDNLEKMSRTTNAKLLIPFECYGACSSPDSVIRKSVVIKRDGFANFSQEIGPETTSIAAKLVDVNKP